MMPISAEPNQQMVAIAPSQEELMAPALASEQAAVAALARKLLLSSRSNTPVQDQLDCAEAAFDLGFTVTARLLFAAAFIRMGRVPDALALQGAVAGRTSLWPTGTLPEPVAGERTSKFQVELAREELGRLASLAGKLPPVQPAKAAAGLFLEEKKAGLPADPPAMAEPLTVARLVDELHLALSAADAGRLAPVLDDAHSELLSRPAPAPSDHAQGSIFHLACLSAAISTRTLLSDYQDLAYAPFGSPEILLESASAVGLGPYLSHGAALLEQPRDIFRLAGSASADSHLVGHLIVLCAGSLTEGQIEAILEALKVGRLPAAVYGLAATAQRRALRSPDVFRLTRDFALARGDTTAAIDAQHRLVERDPSRDQRNLLDSLLSPQVSAEALQTAIASIKAKRAEPVLVIC
jgi:hypothetical protein